MNREAVARELVKLAKELSGADYSRLNPNKVTTLAEDIAVGVLGWKKVSEVLGNGYEFVLTRQARGKGLDKVKGLSKFDLTKLNSSTYASTPVSVVKGSGKRQRELDKLARELVAEWPEDDDAEEKRDKALREFSRHTGGEPIEGVMKIKGDWFVFTTELGAYRLARKYRKGWKELGPSKNYYRGSWWVMI